MKTKNTQIVAVPILSGLPSPNPKSSAPTEVVQNPEWHEPLVTKAQLMAHFGMGERTVERYVREHRMPCHPIGRRQMRFRISAVQAFLEQRGARRFAANGRAASIAQIKQAVAWLASLHGLRITDNQP